MRLTGFGNESAHIVLNIPQIKIYMLKRWSRVSLAISDLHRNHIQMNTFNEISLKLDCRSSFDKDLWHLLKLSTSSSVLFYLAMFVSIWADSLSFSNRMFNEDFKKLNLNKSDDNCSTHIQTQNWSCPILRSINA